MKKSHWLLAFSLGLLLCSTIHEAGAETVINLDPNHKLSEQTQADHASTRSEQVGKNQAATQKPSAESSPLPANDIEITSNASATEQTSVETTSDPDANANNVTNQESQPTVPMSEPIRSKQASEHRPFKTIHSENTAPAPIQTDYLVEQPIRTPMWQSDKAEEIKRLTKNVRVTKDSIRNVTYYEPKKVSADPITLYPTITVDNDSNIVRISFVAMFVNTQTNTHVQGISMQMGDTHWLNFDTVSARVDGDIYELKYDPHRSHRDVQSDSSGISSWLFGAYSISVVEYYEEPMDEHAFDMFRAIAHADDVYVRFSGRDFQTEKPMNKKKIAIEKNMYDLYQVIKS